LIKCTCLFSKKLEVIFGFEFVEDRGVNESDGDGRVRIFGVIIDFGDKVIIRCEGFEDVMVVVEVEGDGVSHDFFLFDYRSTLPKF
jgi:hypothetical protein